MSVLYQHVIAMKITLFVGEVKSRTYSLEGEIKIAYRILVRKPDWKVASLNADKEMGG